MFTSKQNKNIFLGQAKKHKKKLIRYIRIVAASYQRHIHKIHCDKNYLTKRTSLVKFDELKKNDKGDGLFDCKFKFLRPFINGKRSHHRKAALSTVLW